MSVSPAFCLPPRSFPHSVTYKWRPNPWTLFIPTSSHPSITCLPNIIHISLHSPLPSSKATMHITCFLVVSAALVATVTALPQSSGGSGPGGGGPGGSSGGSSPAIPVRHFPGQSSQNLLSLTTFEPSLDFSVVRAGTAGATPVAVCATRTESAPAFPAAIPWLFPGESSRYHSAFSAFSHFSFISHTEFACKGASCRLRCGLRCCRLCTCGFIFHPPDIVSPLCSRHPFAFCTFSSALAHSSRPSRANRISFTKSATEVTVLFFGTLSLVAASLRRRLSPPRTLTQGEA